MPFSLKSPTQNSGNLAGEEINTWSSTYNGVPLSRAGQEGKSGMGRDRHTREKREMCGEIFKKVLLFVVDF